MITLIFNNGVSNHENKLELDALENLESLSMQFDTIEARDLFVAQFPKSLKIWAGFITSYPIDENGNMQTVKTPYVQARKMQTRTRSRNENKITGNSNEAGDKRMARFYEAVKVELAKQ